MQKVIEMIPGHDKSLYGVSAESVITGIIIFIIILVTRALSGFLVPKIFSNLQMISEVAKKALVDSGKALGIAGGCWIGIYIGEDYSMLSSALQLILVIAIVVTAFRFVGVIHAFVMWTDDDGELDGSQKTVITAAESIIRFLIVIFGMIFIADALGFELTTLVAGLGITGIALALAAQDTISNIFGATTVLLDRPFQVGDWVSVVRDGNRLGKQTLGQVTKVESDSTRKFFPMVRFPCLEPSVRVIIWALRTPGGPQKGL